MSEVRSTPENTTGNTPESTPESAATTGKRLSWRLSPAGTVAACTLVTADGLARLEVRGPALPVEWPHVERPHVERPQVEWPHAGLGTRRVHDVPHLSIQSQLLPDDDGVVLMCHHRRGAHDIESVDATGTVRHLATSHRPSASLVQVPSGILVLESTVSTPGDEPGTRVSRLTPDGLVPIGDVAGRAVGAVALDTEGALLAINIVRPGRGGEALELDLRTGASRPLLSVRPTSEDQLLALRGGVVVVSTTALGEPRVGYGRPGSEPVRFPDDLAGPDGGSHLATSADGRLVAVAVERGATTEIRILDTTTGRVATPLLPPLVVIGRGHLAARHLGPGHTANGSQESQESHESHLGHDRHDGPVSHDGHDSHDSHDSHDQLIVPVSTPDHPGTVLRLDLATGKHTFDDPATADSVPLRVVALTGAIGPIECVIVGDPDTASAVVVALHGGPLDSWRAHHDPLLAGLAAAGIAVVAPNVRGSTGYGREHALAIRGQWGGPDLDDVRAVAADLRARRGNRPLPVVLGHSYGAWLAVLAAAAEPDAWSGCVAISAFVSGRRVVDAGGPVAELVSRLGGLSGADASTAAERVTTPTLVLHGAHDTVVAPSEGRRLAEALPPGIGRLVELPDCGHDVFTSRRRQEALDEVVAFTRKSSRRHQPACPTTRLERR